MLSFGLFNKSEKLPVLAILFKAISPFISSFQGFKALFDVVSKDGLLLKAV